MEIAPGLFIPDAALEERFTRASGPGGQHVNKTDSAVQLRLDLSVSDLPGDAVARLRRLAGSRLTKDGVIVIDAQGSRARERNREAARERLAALIARALVKPKPRKKTRPSLSSVRRNKQAKAKRGQTKRLRGRPSAED